MEESAMQMRARSYLLLLKSVSVSLPERLFTCLPVERRRLTKLLLL